MNQRILFTLTLFAFTGMKADFDEQTVGLFLNKEGSFQGYTLFSSMSYSTTYLIDNQGLMVNEWESEYISGQAAPHLTSDGYLYRTIQIINSQSMNGSGGIEKLDWDGNVVWHYEYTNADYQHHHDFEVLPSGNVLMIAMESKDSVESVEAGRDPASIKPEGLWSDMILEIAQTGDSSGVIVWEWRVWDHLVQDYDPTKNNYAEVGNNPQLINLNYYPHPDWTHINSVDYNPEFDQIILSSRNFSEVWVLDHSTTTDEARGHTGGSYGKGGDILYRWGNPQAYDRGTSADQKLFYEHDGNWVPSGYPGEGNILVFNNGTDRGYSSVDEIVPPVDEQGNYSFDGTRFGPEESAWIWTASNPYSYYAPYFSGAQRLPNGNTLMCHAIKGEFLEVTPENDSVWRYINPVTADGPVCQGDTVSGGNAVFKVRRYSPDFPGFEGKDLTPDGPIEKYSAVEEPVTPITPVTPVTPATPATPATPVTLEIHPTLFTRTVTITYQVYTPRHVLIKLYNAVGQEVKTLVDEVSATGSYSVIWDGRNDSGRKVTPGVYFCSIKAGNSSLHERIVLLR